MNQARVDPARARLLREELDGAQAALDPVFLVPAEWRGAGIVERMAAVRTQLCHPRFNHVGEATALGERIGEFSAAAAAHKLGAETLLSLDS